VLGEKEGESITCRCRLKPISTNPNWNEICPAGI